MFKNIKTPYNYLFNDFWRKNALSVFILFVRGMTLASRFFLLAFMAGFLKPSDVGIWGIIGSTTVIAVLFLGLDFYVYNARNILSDKSTSHIESLLKHQLVFYLFTYVIFSPVIVIFANAFIPFELIIPLYVIIVLEHLSQEMYRLLIVLFKPVFAHFIIFVRSGLWIYALLLLMWCFPDLRKIETILWGWISGGSLSIVISMLLLREQGISFFKNYDISWKYIYKGLKCAALYFISSICFKLLMHLDRFFLKHYTNDAFVGVYSFYSSFAAVINTFVTTSVMSVYYPSLVSAYQDKRKIDYSDALKKMTYSSALFSFFVGLGLLLLVYFYVHCFLSKEIYGDYFPLFLILLISAFVMTFSHIAHYQLYAKGHDRLVLGSSVVAVVFTLSLQYCLVPGYGVYGAAMATFCGFLCVLLLKNWFVFKYAGGMNNTNS
jgi:O-antigen/teichoic acid export membrane protein